MSKALIGLMGLLFFMTLPAAAQDIEELFDQGVNLYKRGRLDEALQSFQAVLAENPSNEMAFDFWNKAGSQIFLHMLLERGEYESVAKRFIELARVGRKEKQEDGDRIQELVAQIATGDLRERSPALLNLVADHGEYAVPYMVPLLSHESVETRVNVMTALTDMGDEVVLALVQALASDEVLVRRNAAAVLGDLGDVRAAAALRKMAEMDDDELNREVAAGALGKITKQPFATLPAPAALYLEMATAYLNGNDNFVKPYLPSHLIWVWNDGELDKRQAYKDLYALELAEAACREALTCEPGSKEALALLAFSYAAQKATADAVRTAFGDDEDALPEAFVAAAVKLRNAETLVNLTGPDAVNDALAMALEGNHRLTAVELIHIIGRAGFASPVVAQALQSPSKLIRYSAAMILADEGDTSEEVVSALVGALQESAILHVLVIDNQSDTRNALLNDLNGEGYFAVCEDDPEVGLHCAMKFPLKDLIIVRAGMENTTIDRVVRKLAENELTADTRIMLLVDAGNQESVMSIWEGKVAGFIPLPPVGAAYLPLVEGVLGDAVNPERESAMALSARAGEALLRMDMALLKPHMEVLLIALDREDSVKIPVLGILARLGDPLAMERVKGVFADESASVEVRIAAAMALGAMVGNLPGAPDGDLIDKLVAGVGSDDVNLSKAAGAALGNARALPAGLIAGVLEESRAD